MSKTDLWDALGKTNPEHTKGFKRAGGFSGTSVKPMWVYRRLTEQFGPVGVGWGHNKPDFTVVPAGDETLVYCMAECWHTARENTFFGVGGDKAVAKRSSGQFCDDEAFKKAFTDAVMNAFKSVGVAADIHMGLFDDDKYVAEVEKEFAPPPKTISSDQLASLMTTMNNNNFPVDRFLERAEIGRVDELPASKFKGAQKWLDDEILKMKKAA